MKRDPELCDRLASARARTIAAISDLDDDRLLGPKLDVVNPPLWEVGHVAWFQEIWVLRHAGGRAPLHGDADRLFDSATIPHEARWKLPLWSRKKTLAYLGQVLELVLGRLDSADCRDEERYFATYSLHHEDMHQEALASSRQALGWPAPPDPAGPVRAKTPETSESAGPPSSGDVEVCGGVMRLGAEQSEPFVFDNEKWAHDVTVAPFRISRAATTQAEFAKFVDDGGYERRDLWSGEGVEPKAGGRSHPVYWRPARGGRWERRAFDRWVALEPDLPVIHVNRYEAEAYCRWAGRRLPTEIEWEAAASGACAVPKRRYSWGDEQPDATRARLDVVQLGCADVGAFAGGDAPTGCRQMIGNVWEWTSSAFEPYPGFVRDAYAEYSEPWFKTHAVLRGGSFATRASLIRTTLRNFFLPGRRDIFAGFRTCAL
jgi:gamma-glutamyl hercynylcysteine S-oxide synthase